LKLMLSRLGVSVCLICWSALGLARSPLVLLTDFGTEDGAVSAMKGVAYSVSQDLLISDLSHENPSIFVGAYRLYQAEQFWPADTVFVTVVDPGVGTARLSVVLKTRTGHYFVGPNNGLLSLVAERDGIEELRQIDERVNRRKGSDDSHTFHGRDVFAYTGARLAAGVITFEQVGPPLPAQSFDELHVGLGDPVRVRIFHDDQLIDDVLVPYRRTFGEVDIGKPLLYVNSLLNLAVALNQGSYAAVHKIDSGPDWTIELSRALNHPIIK
jgi:S-adenosylmethionine hydrolase